MFRRIRFSHLINEKNETFLQKKTTTSFETVK